LEAELHEVILRREFCSGWKADIAAGLDSVGQCVAYRLRNDRFTRISYPPPSFGEKIVSWRIFAAAALALGSVPMLTGCGLIGNSIS